MAPVIKNTRMLNNEELNSSNYFDIKELYELMHIQARPNENRQDKPILVVSNLNKTNFIITSTNLSKLRKNTLMRSGTF